MEGVIGYTTGFAGNFAPKNWAFCSGQIINIASNTALFSILGTTYGGNGTTTFGLPDLQGRTVVGAGQGPGLSMYALGQKGGFESTTLTLNQMPGHSHPVSVVAANKATENDGDVATAANSVYGRDTAGITPYSASGNLNMAGLSGPIQMANQGSNNPFGVLRPSIALNYIVCMYGVYPARN